MFFLASIEIHAPIFPNDIDNRTNSLSPPHQDGSSGPDPTLHTELQRDQV